MVGYSSKAGKYNLFVPSVLMVGHSSTAGMYDLSRLFISDGHSSMASMRHLGMTKKKEL